MGDHHHYVATTEVPALIKTRRAFRTALRDSGSFDMVSTRNMWCVGRAAEAWLKEQLDQVVQRGGCFVFGFWAESHG